MLEFGGIKYVQQQRFSTCDATVQRAYKSVFLFVKLKERARSPQTRPIFFFFFLRGEQVPQPSEVRGLLPNDATSGTDSETVVKRKLRHQRYSQRRVNRRRGMPPEDSALLGPRCGAQGCPIEPDRTSATVRGRNRTILSTRPAPNFREEKKKVLPAYQLGTLGHASDEERCTRLVFLFFWWGRGGGVGGWQF